MDRNLSYSFTPDIQTMTKDLPRSEEKFKWGVTPVNKTWNESAIAKWGKSS